MPLRCSVEEHRVLLTEAGPEDDLVLIIGLLSVVVNQIVDGVLAGSVQVPQINAVAVGTKEVLVIGGEGQRVDVLLVAGLEAGDALAFFALADDSGAGQA